MSNLSDYIDVDGLVGLHPQTEPKVPGSQNGFMYTALADILDQDDPTLHYDRHRYAIGDAFKKFGYRRNSITQDVVSFDDLFAMCAFITEVRNDFKKSFGFHPARTSNSFRWWFFRNPVFVSCVYFPTSYSLLRDISICITGLFELGSTPFLMSFLISELYPTREWAKRQLRKRALKRWPCNNFLIDGLPGAFAEYFPAGHPLIDLAEEFERKRSE